MCSPVDPELLTVKGLLPASMCPSLAAAKSGVLPENTVTRMHSSRMRTVRCSGRLSCHACPTPLPCTPLLPCMPHHAHPLPCMPHPTMHNPCHTPYHACSPLPCIPPLWTEFLSHACENITYPQLLLRMVIMDYCIPHSPVMKGRVRSACNFSSSCTIT